MTNQLKRQNRKVVKLKQHNFSIGSVLFIIILLYIVFLSINYLQKEHISIYEVSEKQMSDDNSTVGIALRSEEVYTSATSGNIGFYNSRGRKVAMNAPVYSIDTTGAFSEYLANSENSSTVSSEDIEGMRDNINSFRSGFDFSDYSQVYDFKYSIESDVLSLTSDAMISQIQKDMSSSNSNASFDVCKSDNSGIITYWTDGLESLKPTDVTSNTFDTTNYTKIALSTADSVSAGDAVCKVVTSEKWNIVIKLDDKQYKKLEEKDSVKIRFCKDDLEVVVPFELLNNNNEYFANLSLNEYMARYLDERFIKLELLLNSAHGYKIPVSSLLEKSCYVIPADYVSEGGSKKKDFISCHITNDDGTDGIKEIDTFAMKDDTSIYVDSQLLQPGTTLFKPGTNETFQVGEMVTLKGVYNVNEGYCQFKQVDILYENQEYCIVKKDTEYGLSLYDHIVINPGKINENDIIY